MQHIGGINKRRKDTSLDDWINRIREMLENPDSNALDFVDDFKMNLLRMKFCIYTSRRFKNFTLVRLHRFCI